MYLDNIKQQTLMSDYLQANKLLKMAEKAGVPVSEAVAYIYRAGIQEGRIMGKRTQKRLGQALMRAHDEIKALRKQSNDGKLEAILEAVKAVGNPCNDSVQED